jgi:hypothetical protein
MTQIKRAFAQRYASATSGKPHYGNLSSPPRTTVLPCAS